MKKIALISLTLIIASGAFGDGPAVMDTFEAIVFYLEMGYDDAQVHLKFDELEGFADTRTDIPTEVGFAADIYYLYRTAPAAEARDYVIICSTPHYVETEDGVVNRIFGIKVYDGGLTEISVTYHSPINGSILYRGTATSHLATTLDDMTGVYVYR